MKLAYWLPISWSEYLAQPINVRLAMFDALNEIRSGRGSISGQSRQDKKLGLE